MSAHVFLVSMVIAAAPTALARDLAPRLAHPSGSRRLTLRFAERHPLSNLDEVCGRTGFQREHMPDRDQRERWEYDLSAESFEVIVPRSYRPGVPHGLFVFIPPSDAPAPRGWVEALGRRRMIWVSPRNAGNSRGWAIRLCLALDAVHNMKRRYDIDEGRVYVSGYSGGGLMSSYLVRAFPDVLSGAYCMCGYAFVGERKDETGRMEPTLYTHPWHGELEWVKKDVRIVLLGGEADPMTGPGGPRATCEGLRLEGFERVKWLEVPRLGHRVPDTAWFEKGLAALESEPNPAPPTGPTREPNPGPGQVAQARRILASALSSMDDARRRGIEPWPATRKYLQRVVDEYPTTPSATKARAFLKELDARGVTGRPAAPPSTGAERGPGQ